ncbi:MAG TPA: tetratricopeptide repeat protein [Candidatus Aquilonibacter sp.]|nr:tetratricopeptide repeat protein [Candidatus Aquilonibacter sp.]
MKQIALFLFSGFFLLSSFTLAAVAAGQNSNREHGSDQHAGNHHEQLTTAQLGTVNFPVSCAPDVRKPFERGVALLHSFWYEEAEKEFVDITARDPYCAMAHWGVAMSLWHQLWNEPDQKVILKGLDQVHEAQGSDGPTTPREKAYIAAIAVFYSNSKKLDHQARARAYSNAMKKVYESFPDDNEAAVFYALSLLASEPTDDTTFANRKQAAAILEKLFATEPDHPGVAHYLIHAYDKPQLAELGLPAARRFAQIAPAAPHALHMPSHIFARLGLWQDDINSNLASIAASRKTAAMGMGGEGHQFHAMDFLFYAYMQSGRDADAKALIEEIRAMPNKKDDMYGKGYDPHAAMLVHLSALYPIEMHDWQAAAALPPMQVGGTAEESLTYWARAIGSAHLHKPDDVRKDIAEIERIHQSLIKEKKTEFAEAVEDDQKQAQAWLAFSEGKYDDAVEALRPIADKEDATGDEPDGIPTREMIADILLEAKRPQQALAAYQTDLKQNPNRFNGLAGAARAAEAAGNQKDAEEYYALLLKVCAGSNSTRPELSRARQLVAQK